MGASQSAVVTVLIDPPALPVAGTMVQLTASASTITPGQPINLRAMVTGTVIRPYDRSVPVPLPVPSGQVKFYDGSKLLGTINLGANGQANLSTTATALGVHQFKAVFVGTPVFPAQNSNVVAVTVKKPFTVVSFVTPPVPTTNGTPQIVAVKVTSPQGRSPIGTVKLSINGLEIGTFAVNGNGIASVVFPQGYKVGLGQVKFEYAGSSMFAGSALAVTI